MARVQWMRGPTGGSLLNDVLAGATAGAAAYNDNQARQFAVDQAAADQRRTLAGRRQRLQDERDLIQFREAVKRASEEEGAVYKRTARGEEVRQLKASLGQAWTPDHDAAAEVYRLTGDHGALKVAFTPKDPNKEAYSQLRNSGLQISNQLNQSRLAALQAKAAREAALPGELAAGVDDAVRGDVISNNDAFFNDTGEGMTRGQYDENMRTAAANLQSGRSAAALGKSYTFDRPRIVREAHGTDPDTKRRLDEAEQRREEQAQVAELRAYAKQLAASLEGEAGLNLSDAERASRQRELNDIQAELGRRARQHLKGAEPTRAAAGTLDEYGERARQKAIRPAADRLTPK